jgi:hypothetical protein
MKTTLSFIVALLVGASGASATTIDLGIFNVSPQGTFLYQASNDSCAAYSMSVSGCNNSPTFINLSQYVGDTITVTDVGGLCVVTGTSCQVYPASGSYLGGVFSTGGQGTLLAANNIIRLPDEVSSGLPNINNNPNLAADDGTNTTIPYDFYLPVTNLVVAAPYLVVGTLDSFYSDNSLGTPSSPGYQGFFGVDIQVTTPEPGTATLLLTGVGGLLAFRRKFAKRA